MRKMKKFLCAVLTTTMVLAMAAPSFAALPTGEGSITINSNGEGANASRTYKVYQIFSLESHDKEEGHYAYKVNPAWEGFIRGYKINNVSAFSLNSDGYLLSTTIEKDSSEAAAFAKAALAAVPTGSGEEVIATNGSVVLDDIALGYYLVDSTVGTLCMLTTNAPDITISDKNVAPTLTKTVDGNDMNVQVGQTSTYQIVVNAGNGGQDYVLTDTMSEALDYVDNSLHVYVVDELTQDGKVPEGTEELLATEGLGADQKTNYTFVETDTGFTVTFPDALTSKWTSGTKVVVIYDATVNANAASGTPITNKAKLTYGDDTDTPDTPNVESKTYQFDLQKVNMLADGMAGSDELSGAKFKLYTSNTSDAVALNFVAMNDITVGDKTVKVYRIATAEDQTTVDEIEVGYAVVRGLDKDITYYLEETVAPTGYNLLTGKVAVDANLVSEITENNVNNIAGNAVKIANSTGALLPSTGGIGTTIFYAAGIVLMAGAVFFVVRRKKA